MKILELFDFNEKHGCIKIFYRNADLKIIEKITRFIKGKFKKEFSDLKIMAVPDDML